MNVIVSERKKSLIYKSQKEKNPPRNWLPNIKDLYFSFEERIKKNNYD